MIRRLLTILPAASMVALLLVVLPSCSPKIPVGMAQETPEAAWQVFRQQYCTTPKAKGLLIKTSLHYSRLKPIKRTNRTLVSMWGNFNGAMRLDISAGIGKLLAHIREDKKGLLVFYPSDKKAYAHVNPVLGATHLGMPFPFSLNELASVIVGNFSGLVPKKFATANRNKTNYVYQIDDNLITQVTLDEMGRPIILEGRTTKAYETAQTWRLEINTYEDEAPKLPPLPNKLTLTLDNGETGILHIKSRELRKEAWPTKSTTLNLPDDIEIIRLDNGFHPVENGDIPVVYEDKP